MEYSLLLEGTSLTLRAIKDFLLQAGINHDILSLLPLKGGANNRVFQVQFEGRAPLVLKSYFQHVKDTRPRLQTEFSFLEYAWSQGVRSIPEPIFSFPEQNFALYSYIPYSETPSPNTELFISSAIEFLEQINDQKEQGTHLPKASEACFQMEDYIRSVEKRLLRLIGVKEKALQKFLSQELLPVWEEIKLLLCKADLHALTPSSKDLFLTPSDFGLHNTLRDKNGRFYFIDFEYAGWDDPAKTIADFFLQPKKPIPHKYFAQFSQRVALLSKNASRTLERVEKIFPLCKIKWCCLVLNIFLPTDHKRRQFAGKSSLFSQEKQLELARSYLFSTPIDQR